jgi:ferredoxin-NADP reductase
MQASTRHRLDWRVATLACARPETATARTLVLDVPGWPGHLAGQHVIVRLTAQDGYSAQRSYSLASPPAGDRIEITVQRLADGEVSPYLTDVMEPGDQVEVRGPIGGWFVWDPAESPPPAKGGDPRNPRGASRAPVQLLAGGSGIVPLMSMIRAARGTVPVRLLYSARTPDDVIYAGELARRSRHPSLAVTYQFTRAEADSRSGTRGWAGEEGGVVRYGRISVGSVTEAVWGPEAKPAIFVCGPSGFVEAASGLLVAAGHEAATIKTERFGPTS